jgi:threonine/homoserine efflux transporter RhtA
MSKRSQKPVKATATAPTGYGPLLAELKSRVRAAQVKAALAVNAELVWLYWQMGHRIAQQQAKEGWGAGVILGLTRFDGHLGGGALTESAHEQDKDC